MKRSLWRGVVFPKHFLGAVLLVIAFVASAPAQERPGRLLVCGYEAGPPYIMQEDRDGFSRLSGFDIRILRAAAREAGFDIEFRPVPLGSQDDELKAGRVDVVTNYVDEPDTPFVLYSDPYRTTTDVVFVRRRNQDAFPCSDDEGFVRVLRERGLRLGMQAGDYHGDIVQTYADQARPPAVLYLPTTLALFEALRDDRMDACIVGRLEGATLMSLYRWDVDLTWLPFHAYCAGIHFGFSRRTVTPAEVARFNAGLAEVRRSGEYARIAHDYRAAELASVMSETTERPWFTAMDILGCLVYALSGAILARREGYTVAGALVLASLPTVGGGVIRDLIVDRHPIGILRTPVYMLIVFGVVAVGALVMRLFPRVHGADVERSTLVLLFDTLGVSAYVIVGVKVAVEVQATPLWLWGPLLAAITGAGGGVVRDMVRANRPNALASDFLAEVALIWGLLLSLFLEWYSRRPEYTSIHIEWAFVVCLVGAFATRWFVIRRGWTSPRY